MSFPERVISERVRLDHVVSGYVIQDAMCTNTGNALSNVDLHSIAWSTFIEHIDSKMLYIS